MFHFVDNIFSKVSKKRDTLLKVQSWEAKVCYTLLTMLSLVFIYKFYVIAFSRLGYPYDLEWMEGGSVDHTNRVLNGDKLYVKPSIDFVPYIYTPLSYYLSAVISFIVGKGFMAGRLLSLISITGCFFLMYRITFKTFKNHMLALFTPGLFACTYVVCLTWFDIGRVDYLLLFFLLITLLKLQNAESNKDIVYVAILLFLAYFTKQSAILLYPFVGLIILLKNRKQAFLFSGVLFVLTAGTMVLYQYLSDGWFYYYTISVGQGHDILEEMYEKFWIYDMLGRFFKPFLMACGCLIYFSIYPKKREHYFFIISAIGLIGMSYFGRLHSGGDMNVLMPAYAIVSILCVISISKIGISFYKVPLVGFTSVVTIIIVSQLNHINYDTNAFIPTKEDRIAGDNFIDKLRTFNGPVLISSHGYYQSTVGKEVNAHFMAAHDILRSNTDETKTMFTESFMAKLESQYYEAIIQDNDFFILEVKDHYVLSDSFHYSGEFQFLPVSGVKLRPKYIYTRKKTVF